MALEAQRGQEGDARCNQTHGAAFHVLKAMVESLNFTLGMTGSHQECPNLCFQKILGSRVEEEFRHAPLSDGLRSENVSLGDFLAVQTSESTLTQT